MSFFATVNDETYNQLRAEVGFILDLQIAIETALDQRGLTQADLARLLDVSEARVSQMLSDSGSNLRARTIGRIGDAIGMKPCIRYVAAVDQDCAVSLDAWRRSQSAPEYNDWTNAFDAANQNVWREGVDGSEVAYG